MPLLLLLVDWVSAVVPAAMVLTAPLHCRGRAGAAPPPDGSIVSRQFSYRRNPRRSNMDDRRAGRCSLTLLHFTTFTLQTKKTQKSRTLSYSPRNVFCLFSS